MRNVEASSSEAGKLLGIFFDYRLDFRQQVKRVQGGCHNAMNIIKYLRGTWWGADPDTLLLLNRSFIRSRLDYGLFIYLPSRRAHLDKFEGIQNTAIRLALGF